MASRASSVSDMYSVITQNQVVIQPQTFNEKLQEFVTFVFDADKGEIFGKTIAQWLFLIARIAFMIIFLGLFLAAHCAILYVIIDWNYPWLQQPHSLLVTPGLTFRPMPDHMSTVIRFIKGDASTYTHYLDHTEAYLRYYENENQQGENYIDCSKIVGRRETDLDKVCRYQLEWLGADCVKQQNFGFDDGQPCILLKMNKVFNWIPEEYTNETLPPEVRAAGEWDQWSVKVLCEGETPTDQDNIGPLSYFPSYGFPFKFFPFRNQQGYRSPLVFVRFERPRPGVMLMVRCKLYAKNIYHDTNEMAGITHFELIVD